MGTKFSIVGRCCAIRSAGSRQLTIACTASCSGSGWCDRPSPGRSRRAIALPALAGRAVRTRSAFGIKPGRPIRPRAFARRPIPGPLHGMRPGSPKSPNSCPGFSIPSSERMYIRSKSASMFAYGLSSNFCRCSGVSLLAGEEFFQLFGIGLQLHRILNPNPQLSAIWRGRSKVFQWACSASLNFPTSRFAVSSRLSPRNKSPARTSSLSVRMALRSLRMPLRAFCIRSASRSLFSCPI